MLTKYKTPTKYIVIKDFTLDKNYRRGQEYIPTEQKVTKILINNKFIKEYGTNRPN